MNLIRDLAAPAIYLMTVVSAAIAILVYGATMLRSDGGILGGLAPAAGYVWGGLATASLAGLLLALRRWRGLIIMITIYLLMFLLGNSPTRDESLSADEFLVMSATMSLLILSAALYYDLLD